MDQGLSPKRQDPPGSAAHQVADALASMIFGQLRPGQKLPSEAELAQRFEVSRLTVREAVKLLAGRGLLNVGRGRRAIVSEPSGAVFSDFIVSLLYNDPRGLFDLMELRLALETSSARLAARRASRAALQALESAVEGMDEAASAAAAGEDAEAAENRFHDLDLQFHEALAAAGGNRIISFLFEAISPSLRESFEMSRRGQTMRGVGRARTVEAHRAVLEAIRAGNERAAAAAIQEHLTETERDIRVHVTNTMR